MMSFPKETKDQKEIKDYYGEPGDNQIGLTLPYTMKLSWAKDKKINRFYCHAKVAGSLFRIFKKTLDAYGHEKIVELGLDIWGGCFNVRKKRGGDNYSLHSYGIAVDLDPENNRLRWRSDKAALARQEYDKFWEIVESEGWTSLGRAKGYDWMHFQATGV